MRIKQPEPFDRKSRKFAPWLKDNRRDIESIG